ncbi:MAG: hypothetical protein AAFQ42_08000 [Pseudomonadota bacterium]
MRIVLFLAFLLMTGGYLGATAFQSGADLQNLGLAELGNVGQSATVILALLLPAAVMLIALLAGDAAKRLR